jgi:O-antigen/teichoic acid export membrane protein
VAAPADDPGDPTADGPRPDPTEPDGRAANIRQIRGSSLLLVGRVIGLAIDFVAQVLIVRYLAKDDYGAYAVALSIVAVGTTVCLLGLDRTLGRFAPIYQEHGDPGRMWGTIIVVFSTVATLGICVVLGVQALQGLLGGLVDDRLALSLLLIAIVLSPMQAIDNLLISMFATFGSVRSIFVRRYVIAPLLELSVVAALILTHGDARFLASGYVLVAALGVGLFMGVLLRLLRRQGLLAELRRETLRLPVREIYSFALPLLASDLVFTLRTSLTIVLLAAMRSTTEVAEYRAVLPIAIQNLFVATSFRFIFTPGAARLFALGHHRSLNDLYWQTAAWIAILTFPVFVVGLALAEPVTVLLFGESYRSAGVVLSVLVLGYYINGAIGFNSLALRVFGRVRYMVAADLMSAALSVTLSVLLIGAYGAIGAAVATSLTLLAQNVLYQWGLRTRTTIEAFDRRYARAYGSIAAGAIAMVGVEQIVRPPLVVGLGLAAVTALIVLIVNRRLLRVVETYPELGRFGVVRRFFGEPPIG